MADTQFRWNTGAFYKLRSDRAVIAELERRGRRVLNAANDTLREGQGYRMSSFQGKKKPQGRWFVQVYTSSNHAKRSDAKYNTLLRAIDEAK